MKKGTPLRLPVHGAAIRDDVRMTWKGTKRKDKKRSTPKDEENRKRGILRDKKEPKAPRKATKEENRANKNCSKETTARLLDSADVVNTYPAELKRMNRGKLGRPFRYTDSMFAWILLFMGYMNLSYGQATGTAMDSLQEKGIPVPSISTVHRRIAALVSTLVLGAPPEDARILCRYVSPHKVHRHRRVAVDSNGFSLSNYFQWCEEKWGVENKNVWLKLHALVDIDTCEVLAYVLTYNDVGDPRMLPLLMELAAKGGHKMKILYADGAYGSDENWKIISREYECKFVTSFKVSTTPTNNGCPARGEAAREWCTLPYDEWVLATGYGMRWKVEVVFSDMKRILSEIFRSKTDQGHIVISYAKVASFNIHKIVRAQIMGVTGNGIRVAV